MDRQKMGGYRVYWSGPGGTLNSHVINLKYRDVIYFFCKTNCMSHEDSVALLTALTGTATFNISGPMLHSVFHLGTHTIALGDEKKTTLHKKLHQLHFVIDGCSILSLQIITLINDQ